MNQHVRHEVAEDGSTRFTIVPRRPLPKRSAAMMQAVEREQQKALSHCRAQAIVPSRLMKKKLGTTTFRLWCALLTIRNNECETHPSLPGLAKRAGMSEVQAAKSLVRLRHFKLVEDMGFMYKQVPCRCDKELGYHEHKIYVRYVYGMLKASQEALAEMSVLVPRETVALLTAAPGQGGARAGAGRPKGKLDSTPRRIIKGGVRNSKGGAYKYQELISYEEPTVLQRNAPFHGAPLLTSQASEAGVVEIKVETDEDFTSMVLTTPVEAVVAPSLQPKAETVETATTPAKAVTAETPAAAQAVLVQTVETVATPANVQRQDAPQAQEAEMAETADLHIVVDGIEVDSFEALWALGDAAQSVTFGGSGKARSQRYTPDDMRAATLLANEIEISRVPAPPKVREEHTAEERLALLGAAYSAAHEKVMRQQFWRRGRKEMTAKERQAQLEAAGALMAEGINPTSWARFSFHMWCGTMKKKMAPSARWVWSAARIHEHADWCHEATGSQHTNQPVPGCPTTNELIQLVGKVRAALGWGRPTAVVVEEILPAALKKRLLAKAAQEQAKARMDVANRITAGEWVWG